MQRMPAISSMYDRLFGDMKCDLEVTAVGFGLAYSFSREPELQLARMGKVSVGVRYQSTDSFRFTFSAEGGCINNA